MGNSGRCASASRWSGRWADHAHGLDHDGDVAPIHKIDPNLAGEDGGLLAEGRNGAAISPFWPSALTVSARWLYDSCEKT
jgi:hypothetical protein